MSIGMAIAGTIPRAAVRAVVIAARPRWAYSVRLDTGETRGMKLEDMLD